MKRRKWTQEELDYLARHYPNRVTWAIAIRLQRSERSVCAQANLLGLKKSEAFRNSDWAGGFQPGSDIGKEYYFPKGHTPHNKGKKGYDCGGRSAETRFKKGRRPHTWKPVGTERISKDGILQRKISDTGYPPRDWKSVHSLLWEKQNGPIPKGHLVIFKDGNRENICIENLELISRPENMRRNTIHNLPEPLKDVIRTRGVLNRHINKRMRNHGKEKQD